MVYFQRERERVWREIFGCSLTFCRPSDFGVCQIRRNGIRSSKTKQRQLHVEVDTSNVRSNVNRLGRRWFVDDRFGNATAHAAV
jgi:hypothetical protein